MKPGIPWSVKGIEPDVREAAKEAARRSGMTLGEWLNTTILTKADDTPENLGAESARKPRAAHRAPVASHALERTASRLEDIAEQLSRLSQRDSYTAPPRYEGSERQADSEAFTRILNRVDSNERQTVEAFTAVNERLSVLGRQITQASKQRSDRPEDNPGYVALEKAVRNIVEHMETSEKRNRDNFKSLQERISGMSAKAASAPQEQVTRQAPVISQLEQRINELARRVETSEAAAPSASLPDLLKQELTSLANRIDVVRETSEQLAAKAQTQAVQASQQELRAIESRIVGLVKEAQSSLANNGPAPGDMQRLRGEIERLNSRIDEAQKSQASGGDVKALRAAVEQLSTRVAQGPDMRPLADMDRRILEITQRLEQTQAQTRNIPHVNELEARIAELDNKLNEAVSGQRASATTDIEQHLFDITERVGRTEQQLSSLETIERAVNQLFESLEQQKQWTQNVADTAASRMAEHILSQPQQVSLAGAPEIQALQQGLQAVQQASESADHRNQETLEAVHETLEQIVSKLTELETATIGHRVAAAAMPHAAMPVMEAPAQAQPEPQASFYPESAASPIATDDTVPEPAVETGNPLHAPELDPFTMQPAQAAEEQLSNPFDAVIQSARANTADAAATADSDDFIAAARRAAQASFQPKSILSGIAPGAAKLSEESSAKLKKFNLFKGKGKAKKPAATAPDAVGLTGEIKPPPGFKPANNNDGKRVRLVIMGLCLLAAASFFTFNMLGGSKAPAPIEPTKVEQPAQAPTAQPPVPESKQTPAAAPADNSAAPAPAQPPQPKPAALENSQQGALQTSDPMLTASVDPAQLTDMSAFASKVTKARTTLQQAVAASDADAFYATATRYLEGSGGTKQDYARAAYWYGKAAAQGLAPAQYRLGTLYERGKGVARDLEAAQGWYERSAGLGNVKAMHNAAVLAASSDGHKPDYARAFKWFSLGASHGLKDSQYNLAVLLEHGLGTSVDLTEAMFWYSLAGKQNDPDAARRAATIAKTLSEADVKLVQDRLSRWMPDASADAPNATVLGQATWATDPLPAG